MHYVNDQIRLALESARDAFSLQAARDRTDPDMVKGWRELQLQMQAALNVMPKTIVRSTVTLENGSVLQLREDDSGPYIGVDKS